MNAGYHYENHCRTCDGKTLDIINRSPVFAWDEKESLKDRKKHELYDIFSKYVSEVTPVIAPKGAFLDTV